METDRELLELAAKAADVGGGWDWPRGAKAPVCWRDGTGRSWYPLTDDGDALRLAVKLGLTLHMFPDHHQGAQTVATFTRHGVEVREYAENNADDLNAATRRAIVRAAAEMAVNAQTKSPDKP